jgi:hypothetical protein
MSASKLESVRYGSRRVGVSIGRFYDLVRAGIFPPGVVVRLGRQIRVDPKKLEHFIETGGKALPGGWRWSDDRKPRPATAHAAVMADSGGGS